ncbi:MAG TPA: hypothetical protein VKU00_01560 [Chthonomonadaceae bacterium]|nr:hypothetical protein [Chthonomonadaceae bacterium]
MKLCWMVALYPKRWRARYGEEFTALLETTPTSADAFLDTLRGALDAWLRYRTGAFAEPDAARLRQALLRGFGALLGYVVAGLVFYATLDDTPYAYPRQTLVSLVAPVWILQGTAGIATIALLIGGTNLQQALRCHPLPEGGFRRLLLSRCMLLGAMAISSLMVLWWGVEAMRLDPEGFLHGRYSAFGTNTVVGWSLTLLMMLAMTLLGACSLLPPRRELI